MASNVYFVVLVVLIMWKSLNAQKYMSTPDGLCGPNGGTCTECFNLLVLEATRTSYHQYNLTQAFFPPTTSTPVYVTVIYYFVDSNGNIDYDKNSTWFWSTSTYYLYEPPAVLQYTSLFFADFDFRSANLILTLPDSCMGVEDVRMQLLTQRLQLIAMHRNVYPSINAEYEPEAENINTLVKYNKDNRNLIRYLISMQVFLGLVAVALELVVMAYLCCCSCRNPWIQEVLNNCNEDDDNGEDKQGEQNSSEGGDKQGEQNSSEGGDKQGEQNSSEGGDKQGEQNSSEGGDKQGEQNSSEGGNKQGEQNSSEGGDKQGEQNSSEGGNKQGEQNSSEGGDKQGEQNSSEGDERAKEKWNTQTKLNMVLVLSILTSLYIFLMTAIGRSKGFLNLRNSNILEIFSGVKEDRGDLYLIYGVATILLVFDVVLFVFNFVVFSITLIYLICMLCKECCKEKDCCKEKKWCNEQEDSDKIMCGCCCKKKEGGKKKDSDKIICGCCCKKEEGVKKKDMWWLFCMFSPVMPIAHFIVHFTHIMIGFIHNEYHATSVGLFYAGCFVLQVFMFKGTTYLYFNCWGKKSKKKLFQRHVICYAVMSLCCSTVLFGLLAYVAYLYVLLPINNAFDDAPDRLKGIHSGIVVIFGGSIIYLLAKLGGKKNSDGHAFKELKDIIKRQNNIA